MSTSQGSSDSSKVHDGKISSTHKDEATAAVSGEEEKVDYGSILSELASKSEELSSLSNKEMIGLCQEVLHAFRSRTNEVSSVGMWPAHEARLLGLLGEGDAVEDVYSHPSAAKVSEATARFMMNSVVAGFLDACIKGLEYQEQQGRDEQEGNKKSQDVPELAKKHRSVQVKDKEGKTTVVSVYGPVSLGATAPGHTFEVWTVPKQLEADSEKKEETKVTAASLASDRAGAVTVVLGAGNQSMLTVVDALYRCLACKEVVLIKHHPLRPFLSEPYAIILEPLIRRGYLRQVLDNGIPATEQILSDPKVKHVHITGSLATDKAVRETLARTHSTLSESQINDMVTSELGCVTPWIITPGNYTQKELAHAARMLVAAKKTNGGCNCLAAQAVVLPRDWKQKGEFRKALVEEIARQPNFPLYYPGSKEKKAALVETYSALGSDRCVVIKAQSVVKTGTSGLDSPNSSDSDDNVVLVECGTPGEPGYNGTALTSEAFGPILAIVELGGGADGSEAWSYLEKVAIPFVNDKSSIYGSLSCSLICSKETTEDSQALERAVSSLKYGLIAVNSWTIFGYGTVFAGGTWGAHVQDKTRQSGNGYIGNLFHLPNVAKTVMYGPPLTTAPIMDCAKPPPPIVLDALNALSSAPSTIVGCVRLVKLLVSRLILTLSAPLFWLLSK